MRAEDVKNSVLSRPELVSPPFDSLFTRIGFDALCALAEEFGGGSVYVPTCRGMFKKCFINSVVSEFDGANHKALALKYGFSVISVRRFVGGKNVG